MSSFNRISLLCSLFITLAGMTSSHLCLDNQCECLRNGIMMCEKVDDVSLLMDIRRDLAADYKNLIVQPFMSCEDILMIELVVGLKVLNRDCIGGGGKKEQTKDGSELSDRDGLRKKIRSCGPISYKH